MVPAGKFCSVGVVMEGKPSVAPDHVDVDCTAVGDANVMPDTLAPHAGAVRLVAASVLEHASNTATRAVSHSNPAR